MLALEDIMRAKLRLEPIIEHIPLSYAPKLSKILDAHIYLKKENLQRTGAFKIRGAFNKIALMQECANNQTQKPPQDNAKNHAPTGVIAASAGNHAQGVAYAAQYFALPAIITMPESTPLLKVQATKELGAEVVLSGDNYDESYAKACEIAKKRGLEFIHPFADEAVMAGQGTIGLEMIAEQELDFVLVPIGGGGLISGIASAYRALSPHTKIIGITAKGAPAMRESFASGKIKNAAAVRTIADGIAVRDVNPLPFSYIQEGVDEILQVDDEEIASAILYLLENQKLIVEGAGAVGVAALLHKKLTLPKSARVGVVLSGGNIDVTMLNLIIQKGLVKTMRKFQFQVLLVDKPGALQTLSDLFVKAGANIVQIDYDRTSTNLAYGDAYVIISLETKGAEHKQSICQSLLDHGYDFKEIF